MSRTETKGERKRTTTTKQNTSNSSYLVQEVTHPASRAFSYGTYALYREKALHESCQVLVEHAQRVAKKQFRTQTESVFI